MTTDMAQWSEAAPRLAAIKGQLGDTTGIQPAQLTAQLPALADACFEAGWSGSADLLALLTELLEAEEPESALTPDQQQQLLVLFSLMPSVAQGQPSDEQLSSALSMLSGAGWQSPLDPDDLDALPEMLQQDWQQRQPLDSTAAEIETIADTAPTATDSADSVDEDFLFSLDDLIIDDDESDSSAETDDSVDSPQALAEQLLAQAEPLAELDNPLPADLVALATELIDSCDDLEQPIISRAKALLQTMIEQPNRANVSAVIDLLGSGDWPAPLDAEELADQRDLLDEVYAAPLASEQELASRTPAESVPAPTPEQEPEQVSMFLDADADDNETNGSPLDGADSPDALVDRLNELSEPLADADPPLLADLVALTGELIGSCETLDLPVIDQAKPLLLALISTPGHSSAEAVVDLLAADGWPEPLEAEDVADQRALLDEYYASNADRPDAVDTAPATESTAQTVESVPGVSDTASILDTADSPEALAELLGDLSEPLAESDNPLLADLIALGIELISNCDSLDQPLIKSIKPVLHDLIETRSRVSAEAVLDLLSSPDWPEPLEAEDIDGQRELLAEFFADAADTDQDTFLDTETTTAAAEETAEELPPFCDIDMALLEQPGPSVDPGILTMLVGSLQALQEQWGSVDANQAEALLEASQDALTPLARACTTIHLNGLNLLLTGLDRNLAWFRQHPEHFHDAQCAHFAACLQAVHQHLEALADKGTREDLIDVISADLLPIHADAQQGAFISGLLALASIQSPDEIECETATPEDVILAVGDEIDPQLMEMLYDELPVLVEEFQTHLQAVLVDHEADSLLSAQRAAHTIKGLANMAGIKGLANLTHHLEDILEVLTNAKTFPGSQLSHDLTEASDCLAQMSESITEASEAPDNAQQQLQQMMTWFYRLQTEGVECAAEALSEDGRAAQAAQPAPPPKKPAARPASAAGHEGEKEHAHLRVPVSILDNLFRIAGESSTLNAQLDDSLTQLRRLSRSNRERQRALQKVLFDLEQQLQDHFTLNSHLHEGDSHFDPLEMDRYNSMHTTLSQLQEAVADVREVDLEADHQLRQLAELHVRQSNLQKESLDNVLHTRLVAVKTISSRMQRIMRQACSAAGKEARLLIEGEDVMMDSQILNQLADPLMHIIRNAVDHGLETPHLRFEAGKDETGTLTIRFSQRDGKVHVSCEDDGAGINLQRVRDIAVRKELISPDAELSDHDIQRLILVPGFSTRDEISQLSGRGIGMDVVYQQVSRMQGSLNIDSTQGQGSRFALSMPASSLLVHTLLVRSHSRRIFALSSHTVEQSLLSLDGELKQTGNGLTFTTEEGVYPAYTLESLIGEPSKEYHSTRIHPVLMVNLDHGRKAAVLVREVLAHRELVFKSLGEHLPDIAGVPGVTILANGEVAPIIDLQARILDRDSILGPAHEAAEPAFELRLPQVLVVDDSLSARKTLATLLSDSGYQVATAIDGLDALDKVRSDPPELILTDLEMPRMTGMELAAIIRNSSQFSKIPVVMITSRSTHKHRGEAEAAGVSAYLTKPWTEAKVLETVQSLLF